MSASTLNCRGDWGNTPVSCGDNPGAAPGDRAKLKTIKRWQDFTGKAAERRVRP